MQNNITAEQALEWLNTGEALLVDVREPDEFKQSHIAYAMNIPLSRFAEIMASMNLPAEKKLIMQCLKGGRGEQACQIVTETKSFKNKIYNMEGGITAWKEANLPIVTIGSGWEIMRQVQVIMGFLIFVLIVLGLLGYVAVFFVAAFFAFALGFAGLTGWCGLAKILKIMPWNK
ncbi:MAG: sulfurtransferase [Micavibrio sp.]|nr:sulfurtransferase [Micavibrio sp.]|tara:strand:- start:3030 stop:3551 length:522 start_codon:yes stop_codon:yes gene_type:complete